MLPLSPPVTPMLARVATTIPEGCAYEPKWDGFRCLVFRDNDQWVLQSRSGKDLLRYFPELPERLRAALPDRCVVDGEIVLPVGDRLDFSLLGTRVHPAAKRIRELAAAHPTQFVAWDLLASGTRSLLDHPYTRRRDALLAEVHGTAAVHLTPSTTDRSLAEKWFTMFEGAGLDGIVAKPLSLPYQPGERGFVKVKHRREADVVVAAWRTTMADPPAVASLQLGLHDGHGRLHWVGGASAFRAHQRSEMAEAFSAISRPLAEASDHPWSREPEPGVRHPGGVSRWRSERGELMALSPMLVATVGFDQLEGTRFRHVAKFLRWRPDREPSSCGFDQLETPPAFDLASVLAGTPSERT